MRKDKQKVLNSLLNYLELYMEVYEYGDWTDEESEDIPLIEMLLECIGAFSRENIVQEVLDLFENARETGEAILEGGENIDHDDSALELHEAVMKKGEEIRGRINL